MQNSTAAQNAKAGSVLTGMFTLFFRRFFPLFLLDLPFAFFGGLSSFLSFFLTDRIKGVFFRFFDLSELSGGVLHAWERFLQTMGLFLLRWWPLLLLGLFALLLLGISSFFLQSVFTFGAHAYLRSPTSLLSAIRRVSKDYGKILLLWLLFYLYTSLVSTVVGMFSGFVQFVLAFIPIIGVVLSILFIPVMALLSYVLSWPSLLFVPVALFEGTWGIEAIIRSVSLIFKGWKASLLSGLGFGLVLLLFVPGSILSGILLVAQVNPLICALFAGFSSLFMTLFLGVLQKTYAYSLYQHLVGKSL